jgi:putative endonuclease
MKRKPPLKRTAPADGPVFSRTATPRGSTKSLGDAAEDQALEHLQRAGLRLVERNFRIAQGPTARGGEVDLILRDRDGTLVFAEVRKRRNTAHGGAAASVVWPKQRRLIYAAQRYLMRFATPPACRFDVVAIDGDEIRWLKAAFEAG